MCVACRVPCVSVLDNVLAGSVAVACGAVRYSCRLRCIIRFAGKMLVQFFCRSQTTARMCSLLELDIAVKHNAPAYADGRQSQKPSKVRRTLRHVVPLRRRQQSNNSDEKIGRYRVRYRNSKPGFCTNRAVCWIRNEHVYTHDCKHEYAFTDMTDVNRGGPS